MAGKPTIDGAFRDAIVMDPSVLQHMTHKQALLAKMRSGLVGKPMSYADVAAVLGRTPMNMDCIKARALKNVMKHFDEKHGKAVKGEIKRWQRVALSRINDKVLKERMGSNPRRQTNST